MSRLFRPSSTTRTLQSGAIVVVLVLVCFIALRVMAPDPSANLFWKARRLELAGQQELALRHYALLTEKSPDSSFAPEALERQAEILAGLGRRDGDTGMLRHSLACYQRIAEVYPQSPRAGDALLNAGNIALTDLSDTRTAKQIYLEVLERYPNNAEYASDATLRLGRLALKEENGPNAKTWFQRVLQRYPRITQRCAEAQYHLGVAYETLFKNREWAQNAYIATFTRYPQSVWAADAKEALGFLEYTENANRPKVRRVLIETEPLPRDSSTEGMMNEPLLAALRLILAARGIEADETVFRGWSLLPFWAAFDPKTPSHAIAPPMEVFDNIVANANLSYSPTSGGDEKRALLSLQDVLNDGRAPLVYDGRWMLAVGYDSSRGEVYLQENGSRIETMGVKEFSAKWQKHSPVGGSFTMIAFRAPGDRPRAKPTPTPVVVGPLLKPEAETSPTPTPTPALTAPTTIFELPKLSIRTAHQRTLKRAIILMRRPREGKALINLAALNTLANELERLGKPTISLPLNEDGSLSGEEVPARTAATPLPVEQLPAATPRKAAAPSQIERARALLGWFKTPKTYWTASRRDAAAYCDAASDQMHDVRLRSVADHWRTSIAAIERATRALPSADILETSTQMLSDEARTAFAAAAREVRAAYEAEKAATEEMAAIVE